MPAPLVPIAALYGCMNALLNVALGANVSRVRGTKNVFLGDGGQEPLTRAIRAHGNNSETVPIALLLLLILELNHVASLPLHIFGGTLLLSRVLHAHGLLSGVVPTRVGGILLTWLVIAAMAVFGLYSRCVG